MNSNIYHDFEKTEYAPKSVEISKSPKELG